MAADPQRTYRWAPKNSPIAWAHSTARVCKTRCGALSTRIRGLSGAKSSNPCGPTTRSSRAWRYNVGTPINCDSRARSSQRATVRSRANAVFGGIRLRTMANSRTRSGSASEPSSKRTAIASGGTGAHFGTSHHGNQRTGERANVATKINADKRPSALSRTASLMANGPENDSARRATLPSGMRTAASTWEYSVASKGNSATETATSTESTESAVRNGKNKSAVPCNPGNSRSVVILAKF